MKALIGADDRILGFTAFGAEASELMAVAQTAMLVELPSGSSKTESHPEEVAAEELYEETGFVIESSRLVNHGKRQLAGTFSAHKANLYSAELKDDEIKWFKSQAGIMHGNIEDSEQTYIEVHTLANLIDNNLVDWTTLGMILSILA